ncbi:granulin a isoform X2 [Clupea harengus]|uniref:Granulin a isoform X2 n=1 Tax=Clupea harengus TaxID=7950 RepID=A0A6P8EX55_CLUHA|nr:granulin a isoform X2 [Clupea harengus]
MLKEAVVLLAVQALVVSIGSMCPDRDVCEERHTCCQGPTGEYSCCPHHQGECCDDHLHCCPEHTICQMEEGNSRCVNATHSLPRTERIASRQSSLLKSLRVISASPVNMDAVVCPDKTFCPAEFSCVKLPITYGCCPIAQGIVCADGKHCCPEGLECSSDGKSCIQPREPVVAVICSDGLFECPQGASCCQSSDGVLGCCPFPRAVFCDDTEHCCPEDSTCDVKNSKCISSTNQHMPMWAKFPARLRADWEDHDRETTTESKLETSTTQAVTAEPETTSTQPNTAAMMATQPSNIATSKDVPCNNTVACEDANTCCKTAEDEWVCCPLPKAVCCEDHFHCCPEGTTCDGAHGTCQSVQSAVPMQKKLPALSLPPKENDVACDSTHACADGTTCCKTETGEWACCPLAEAVCCEDHIHCCPKGTTCDVEHDTCQSAQGPVPMLTKLPALALPPKENNVTCDSTHACADGTTCCKTETGEWACCPLAEAVCCEDHIHCCPKGTTCDVEHDTCQSAQGPVPMLTKLPALALPPKENDVACDSTHACADGTTCCKTETGEWACCPLAEAVCCEDHIHCCPKGTTCDVAHDTCQSAQGPVPMLTKLPALALPPKENDVACDSTHACADGTTCCKTETGEWACCPLAEAVCCEDHIHCCPKGTTCDVAHDTCQSAQGPVPMLTKLPALSLPPKENDVTCDSTHACADGTTCCKDDKGEWGCCPLAEAVCCEDHIHCCPKGTTCDVAHDTCQSAQGPVPMLTKLPALALPPKENNVTCDSSYACADGTTCCKDDKGGWACCPLAEAVCCDDNTHCCPKGTICDVAAQTCLSATGPVPVFTKLTATAVSPEVKEAPTSRAQCDASTSCPDHNTCCFMKEEKTWGCCPLADGLCCEDGEHCCPHGYKCDMATTTCINGDVIIPWYNKLPAQSPPSPSESVAAVTCASQSSCPSGSSCCQLSNEKLGCCPLTGAVCCSDQAHCCPQGYVCNLEAGSCQRSTLFQVQMLPLIRVMEQEPEKPGNVHEVTEVKCDDAFSCVDEETCCRAEEGWGCCPAPKATCCTDKKHCCPAGYSCDDGGSCIQSTRLHKDNWQVFFSKKKRALVF